MVDLYQNSFKFLKLCKGSNITDYRLSPNSEVTAFALTFAIYNYNFLGEASFLKKNSDILGDKLVENIKLHKEIRSKSCNDLSYDKSYLQLLCFTLSALRVLKKEKKFNLEEETVSIFKDISAIRYIKNIKSLEGVPGSGNLSMFYAIILIYKSKFLNYSIGLELENWLDFHLNNINSNGFWGHRLSNPFLQFQNGYHQYEIFNYVGNDNLPWSKAARFVSLLADKRGQFAPYPGGGGCYDYDAVFFLTSKYINVLDYKESLFKLRKSLLISINKDGGFCESQYIRPRSIKNIFLQIEHFALAKRSSKLFVLRRILNILLDRNNRIKTHWSNYSRHWYESDLWDTWFRNLTIFKIERSFNLLPLEKLKKFKSINFPGIGYE